MMNIGVSAAVSASVLASVLGTLRLKGQSLTRGAEEDEMFCIGPGRGFAT